MEEAKVIEHINNIIVSQSLNPEEILKEVVDCLYKLSHRYNWVGIYMVQGNELVLKAWQGPQQTEHTRIPIGQGICGLAASKGKTEIANDVSKDPDYLACFNSTKSEIVVPIKKNSEIIGEIDIDSNETNAFDIKDKKFLEAIATVIVKVF